MSRPEVNRQSGLERGWFEVEFVDGGGQDDAPSQQRQKTVTVGRRYKVTSDTGMYPVPNHSPLCVESFA